MTFHERGKSRLGAVCRKPPQKFKVIHHANLCVNGRQRQNRTFYFSCWLTGDAPHTQRGRDAQAWGVTEALRVWKILSR